MSVVGEERSLHFLIYLSMYPFSNIFIPSCHPASSFIYVYSYLYFGLVVGGWFKGLRPVPPGEER